MDTNIWGKSGWTFLHCIAHNYPEKPTKKKKEIYKNYFYMIGDILPCKYCRKSYKKFIKQIPIEPYLNSRQDMTYWLYLIHNKVNNKLRKQGYFNGKVPEYEKVCKKYENYRAKCSKSTLTCKKIKKEN